MTESLFHAMVAKPMQLQAVTMSQPVTALAAAKWMDPALGLAIAQIKPHAGDPRSQITVPIAPSDAPSDAMVFEAPGNPGQRFYLPRYSVATQDTDRGTQFRIRLTRQDPGTRVSVVVQPSMAPEVRATAPDAAPLDHELAGVLSFEVPGSGMKREWVFADRRDLPDGVELSVVLPTLNDRGEVYDALTSAAARGTFTVRRTFTVAVPSGTAQPDPGPTVPDRPTRIPGKIPPWMVEDRFPFPRKPGLEPLPRMQPMVVNWMPPPIQVATVPKASPAQALRARVSPEAIPAAARVLAGFRRAGEITELAEAAVRAGEQLFRATTRSLDQVQAPSPFVFSKDLHAYIYGDITGTAGQGGLVLEQIAFGGRHHSYYFAAGRPEVVYYLPDAFKLARTPEAPHPPMMSVSFDSPDGKPANTSVNVAFAASAVASPARLLDAATKLAAKAGRDVTGMDLQPFLADSSRLTLQVSLPGSAGASTTLEGARIDLRTALSAGFRLPLATFLSMYDRLNGTTPTLFDGEVEVRLDRPDRAAEKVPLIVDLADLAGPTVQAEPARAGTGYTVTLTNVVESPVRLNTVTAHLPQPTGPIACDLQPPVAAQTLAARAALTTDVVPARQPEEPDVLPEVTLTSVTVTPDPSAIWEAICDDTISYVARHITVKAPAQLFTAGPDGSQILALVVEIGPRGGGLTETVELSADSPSAVASVNTPIADLVRPTDGSGEYRYRVSTVRADRVTDGDWAHDSKTVKWIVSADVT